MLTEHTEAEQQDSDIHTYRITQVGPLWSSLEYNIAAEIFVDNLDPCHLP